MRLLAEVTRGNESDQVRQIQQHSNDRQAANKQQQSAIQAAITEQQSGSFWGDVAKVFSYVGSGIAIAASVAALPFSGGASALVVVCAVTSLATSAASLTLQVAADTDLWQPPLELTLTLAGVGLLAGVGALLSGGARAVGTAAQAATNGAAQGAGATAQTTSAATHATTTATRVIKTATGILEGITAGTRAGAGIASAYHQSESIDRRADATQADGRVRDAQYRITSLLQGLGENESARQRFVRRTHSMESNRHQAAMQTIRG